MNGLGISWVISMPLRPIGRRKGTTKLLEACELAVLAGLVFIWASFPQRKLQQGTVARFTKHQKSKKCTIRIGERKEILIGGLLIDLIKTGFQSDALAKSMFDGFSH